MFAMATTPASGFDCKQHQLQLTCNGCKATATVMTIQNLDLAKYQLIHLESVDICVILPHEREATTSLKNNCTANQHICRFKHMITEQILLLQIVFANLLLEQ